MYLILSIRCLYCFLFSVSPLHRCYISGRNRRRRIDSSAVAFDWICLKLMVASSVGGFLGGRAPRLDTLRSTDRFGLKESDRFRQLGLA